METKYRILEKRTPSPEIDGMYGYTRSEFYPQFFNGEAWEYSLTGEGCFFTKKGAEEFIGGERAKLEGMKDTIIHRVS